MRVRWLLPILVLLAGRPLVVVWFAGTRSFDLGLLSCHRPRCGISDRGRVGLTIVCSLAAGGGVWSHGQCTINRNNRAIGAQLIVLLCAVLAGMSAADRGNVHRRGGGSPARVDTCGKNQAAVRLPAHTLPKQAIIVGADPKADRMIDYTIETKTVAVWSSHESCYSRSTTHT